MQGCRVLSIALAVLSLKAWSASDSNIPDLQGLWKAERTFASGTPRRIIVKSTSDGLQADIEGAVVPVRSTGRELSFESPNGEGKFAGRLDQGRMIGHWTQADTAANNNRYMSPVVLERMGDGWSGIVTPNEDRFSFYLLLTHRPDGSYDAVLRNPERDVGTQQHVARLELHGSQLDLIASNRGKDNVVSRGSFDSENETLNLDFPSRGGHFDFHRDGESSNFFPRGKSPERYRYQSPPRVDDGWPVSSLVRENIDTTAIEAWIQQILDQRMDSPDAPQIHAVLIARNGRLLLEEYFHGARRDQMHETRSASKVLTSVLTGALLRTDTKISLDNRVYDVMSGGTTDPAKQTMTLDHLLTMSSGFHCDDSDDSAPGNENKMLDQTREPNYYRYTLAVPNITSPGEKSVYCSINPNLALGMLGLEINDNPLYAFDRLVGGPMHINRYAWPLDPAGNPYGGGGVRLLPRDFMKFGELLVEQGRWQGRAVMSADYTALSIKPAYQLSNIQYSHLWWSELVPYKNREVRMYMALGTGAQTIAAFPELNLVVVIMAGNYGSRTAIDVSHNMIPNFVLPAVRERGDDPRSAVVSGKFKSAYGRSADGHRL